MGLWLADEEVKTERQTVPWKTHQELHKKVRRIWCRVCFGALGYKYKQVLDGHVLHNRDTMKSKPVLGNMKKKNIHSVINYKISQVSQ